MVFKNKRILSIATVAGLFIATNAMAETVPGFYVGGQIGWAFTNQGGFSTSDFNHYPSGTVSGTSYAVQLKQISSGYTDSGVAWNAFGGYQFNNYFALETGFISYSIAKANASASGLDILTANQTDGVTLGNSTVSYSVDFVGKGILPLKYGFSVTGILGAAYLNEATTTTASVTITPPAGAEVFTATKSSTTVSKILPMFGIGLSGDISKYASVDLNWDHIQKAGSTTLQNVDYFGLGISYHFGYL